MEETGSRVSKIERWISGGRFVRWDFLDLEEPGDES